ncbi:MAG: flagellar basal body rod protein FlgF, partial [Gammaproteobacteria bacterium]|nr:flagellar basal body rod protein FlgF [Gammaproteobacteria bacterium]
DHFQSKPVSGPGHLDRVYASNEAAGANLNPGAIATTGRGLDLAISGEGWFAVQADDGGTAFSRRGDFRIDPTGLLLNGANQIVLGESGPITIPQFESLQIGRDGSISIRATGQAANTLVGVDRIRLVNPARDQLYRGDDGLFRSRDVAEIPADASVAVTSGALESSNVNAVDAMVRMIDYARYYEQQVKLMKLASDNDAASARLMRMSG